MAACRETLFHPLREWPSCGDPVLALAVASNRQVNDDARSYLGCVQMAVELYRHVAARPIDTHGRNRRSTQVRVIQCSIPSAKSLRTVHARRSVRAYSSVIGNNQALSHCLGFAGIRLNLLENADSRQQTLSIWLPCGNDTLTPQATQIEHLGEGLGDTTSIQ